MMARRFAQCAAAATLWLVVLASPGRAQLTPDHPGEYTQADIDSARASTARSARSAMARTAIRCRASICAAASSAAPARTRTCARIVTNGIPGTGMPPFALQPAEMTGVIAFIRAGFDPAARPIRIGDASRGQAIVEGKGGVPRRAIASTAAARAWRPISATSASRAAPHAIHRTLTDPSSGMMPINRPVRIVMKDGRTITGRRLNEDTFTVQIIDDKERLHSLAKSDMRS